MKSISVVLATLGEKNIFKIIESLNDSNLDIEIIIVIPKNNFYKIKDLKNNKNIIIIKTNYSSQTKQRLEGFKVSKKDFVLQLDSDVEITEFFLEEIINYINSKDDKCAVALHPIIIKKNHNIVSLIYRKILDFIFIYFIKREHNFNNWDSWFTKNLFQTNEGKVKLLNGVCILHYKKNLIFDDYYKYNQKAYGEDILHSCIMYKKNISFYMKRSKNINFSISEDYIFKNISEVNFYVRRMSLVYYQIFLITKGNYLIFYIWFFLWYINNYIRFFFKKLI